MLSVLGRVSSFAAKFISYPNFNDICKSITAFFVVLIAHYLVSKLIEIDEGVQNGPNKNVPSSGVQPLTEPDLDTISSPDDDMIIRSLTQTHDNPDFATQIVRIKHNDPDVVQLKLPCMLWRSSRTIGQFIGQNTVIKELTMGGSYDLDLVFRELKVNTTIQKLVLDGTLLHPSATKLLASWLISNKSLKELSFLQCQGHSNIICTGIGSAEVNVLSDALSKRSEYSLERFSLNAMCAHSGDIDFEVLIQALMKHAKLKYLGLVWAEIARKECASIAKLLRNKQSPLEELDLSENRINDDCAMILVDSLSVNRTLTKLEMKFSDNHVGSFNDPITKPGWTAILKLVCNTSSVTNVLESNHTLTYLGFGENMNLLKSLGEDDAILLLASLDINSQKNKDLIMRHKIIWGHARGNLNIGVCSIHTGAIPRILAWFGSETNEIKPGAKGRILCSIGNASKPCPIEQKIQQNNTKFHEFHSLPLPNARVGEIRLDSVFRIVRSRPDIVQCTIG